MTIDNIYALITKLADTILVWIIFYFLFKIIRNNIKMVLLFKGVLIVVGLKIVSDIFDLRSIGLLIEYMIMWGPLAIIIIFQPEIRNVLEQLGRSQLLGRHKVLTMDEREQLVYEIMNAVTYLKKERIGALMVIERDVSLRTYIEKSKPIYADVTSDLLISTFFPNSPFHDGACIIQGSKLSVAGAILPVCNNPKISDRLGTRHRAGLGLSEEADSIVLIVSEETGRISIALNGELNYNLTLDDTKIMLLDELKPKKLLDDLIFDEETQEEGE